MTTAVTCAIFAWAFTLGASIGSFLNVVVYRVPNGLSVVRPGSHCPACGHPVRWYDNVPVLGWLVLRGRCRDCAAPISPKYILIEVGFGLFAVAIANALAFHGHPEVVSAEISAGVVTTLLALLPPVLAGLRRQKLDDADIRQVARREAARLHSDSDDPAAGHLIDGRASR